MRRATRRPRLGFLRALPLALLVLACGAEDPSDGGCVPEARRCQDRAVQVCRTDDTWETVVVCPSATSACDKGSCVPLGFGDATTTDLGPTETFLPTDTDSPDIPPLSDAEQSLETEPGIEINPEPDPPDAPDPPAQGDAEGSDAEGELEAQEINDTSPDLPGAEEILELAPEAVDEAPEVEETGEAPLELVDEPTTPACGDGHVDPGEDCEPGLAVPTTCSAQGYAGGAIACRDDCQLNTSGCDAFGAFSYHKVTNITIVDDLTDVAWSTDGSAAWIITQAGQLVRFDPLSEALEEVALPSGFVPRRLVFWGADGRGYVGGHLKGGSPGNPGDELAGRIFRFDPEDLAELSEAATLFEDVSVFQLTGYEWIALSFAPGGKQLIAGARRPGTSGSMLRMATFGGGGAAGTFEAPTTALSHGLAGWPNLNDVVWGNADTYGTSFVTTSAGVNGANSDDWLPESDLLIDNGWKNSFGNPGRGAWMPGGGFAAFAATSTTRKIYVYEGGLWYSHSFSASNFNASSVVFNASGTRMLVIGRAGGGTNLVGSVVELRPGGGGPSSGAWVDQSIPDFDTAPWLATTNTYLHHAAFRPQADCTEGLIVASDNGYSYAPTLGLLIRFHDSADPNCP